MSHFNKIENLLRQSFEDHRLDKQEKYELKTLLSSCSDEQRSFARNKAFDLIREQCNHGREDVIAMLSWLEKTVKAIDHSSPPSHLAKTFFSPGEDCYRAIVNECMQAKNSIDVCVFTISDNRLRDALYDAYRRDVRVRILTDNDKSEDRGSDIDELMEKGVEVRMDKSSNHMHHKFAIFDKKILINGSFNWTRSATERNQENITLQDDQRLIEKFIKEFEVLWSAYA